MPCIYYCKKLERPGACQGSVGCTIVGTAFSFLKELLHVGLEIWKGVIQYLKVRILSPAV